jgi:hypothetical protein
MTMIHTLKLEGESGLSGGISNVAALIDPNHRWNMLLNDELHGGISA